MDVLPFPRDRAPEPARASFAGLDAVRALAALGVVLLHAGVPYAEHPMPGLSWPVRDGGSLVVDVIFWSIELVIMPVFLVLAGFLAWRTLSRRGPAGLLRSRVRRLALPLLFGAAVILPIELYIWLCGWLIEGRIEPVKLRSLKIDGPLGRDLWGLSHLWFLQYLLLYLAVVAAVAAAWRRVPGLRRWSPGGIGGSAALLGIASATLYCRPEVVWGFQHAFAPVPSKWLYSFTFFVGGMLLAVRDPALSSLRAVAPRLIAAGAVVTAAAVTLGRWHLAGGQSQAAGAVLALLSVAGAWTITLGAIGLAERHRVWASAGWVTYLSAASFWIYLVHHPVLALAHIDLKWSMPGLDPAVKMFSAFAVSVGWSLLSYEVLIRRTAFGVWLGLAARRPAEAVAAGPPAGAERPEAGTDDLEPRRRAA